MGVAKYLVRKGIEAFITIFIGLTVAFFLFRLLPGDPTAVYLDIRLTPEAKKELMKTFGLDKPLYEQYIIFLINFLHGNLGLSFVYHGTPVSQVIFGPRLFNTIILMGSSMFIAAIIATFMGLIAGWKRGSIFDRISITLSYMGASAPVFWVGLLILLFLGSYYGLIPISGTISTEVIHASLPVRIANYLWHMIGPLLTLIIYFIPTYMLYVRNDVVSLLGEDFITTLIAKGLSEKLIVFKHLMRYVLITVVTLLAVQSPLLVTGAILTETVFGWNGIGLLLYNSVLSSDYPVVQGIFIITIIVVVLANLLADVVYAILDPRVKLR